MLNWLFNKRKRPAAEPAATAPPPPATAPAPAVDRVGPLKARLVAAQGDDAALLALAREATPLPIKLAAVAGLEGEDALKAAEREFRRHDRRVHQLAKQRLDAVVTRRESRAAARALTDAVRALASDAILPLNRLAQLDRDWQALAAADLEPGQTEAFAAARAALDAAVREREAQRRQQREQRAAAAAAASAPAEALAPPSPPAGSPAPVAADLPPPPPPSPPEPPEPKPERKAVPGVPRREQLDRIDALLLQAEESIGTGQLAALPRQLAALDAAFDAIGMPDDARRARRQAVAAEFARLRSWQQWGGARAVDVLVEDAEALAQATAAATAAPPADGDAAPAPALKLDAHGAAIRDLRTRWKALQAQHAAAGAAQWRCFDAALQAAYAPIAAHHAQQKAQRRDNLAAREALLAALDALPVEPLAGTPGEHWRQQIRRLERLRADWRALGPLEHKVPRESREALRQRLQHSVERIEAPLAQARAAAAVAREALIEAALALAQDVSAQPQLRDTAAQARALQAEWARQARELPLAHGVETALWARFRAAIDTVFTQRQAAAEAHEATLAANLATREAQLARLAALTPDTPATELRRTLAEVDAGWRASIELPRGAADAVDSRFRAAREAAQHHLAGSTQRRWQGQCDALAARLALCEAREDGGGHGEPTPPGAEPAPSAPGVLPAPWERALAQRWVSAAAGPLSPGAFDEVLLQLEAALALPAAPELQQARRELKLRAMKDTLEGRAAAAQGPAQQAGWLVDALRQRGTSAAQRERLRAIVAALRRTPATAFGSPIGKG